MNECRNILVIGGGKFQCEGIKKLIKKNYSVILIDVDENCEGKQYASVFFCADILDPIKLITLLENNKIKIISAMCFSIEVALRSVAYINNYYSLPGINLEMVKIATDKALQRKIMIENNLPCPFFLEIYKDFDDEFITKIKNYPVIIKPTDNAGSRGVIVCNNKDELKLNFNKSLQNSKFDNKVVLEEFIPGIEFTVEAVVVNNEVKILGISEKKKPVNNFTVSIELFYNSPFVEIHRNSIEEIITIFLKSCNFNNTITHTEIMYSFQDNKFYIIESTVRGGGMYIFDKILPYITGFDSTGLIIDLLLGKKVDFPQPLNRPCILGFFHTNKGKIKSIYTINETLINNIEYGLFVKENDEVGEWENDTSRIGYFLTYANNWQDAFLKARLIEYCIRIEII
ncbi:MAG: ATP-grasp domain-containing protein [Bacteroidales bacterium]